MAAQTPHVLIIGGGIGGLALANGLKKHNISFHVYERDQTQSFRAQGYRIRLAGEGIIALQSLLDEATYANFRLICADMRMRPIVEIDAISGQTAEMIRNGRPFGAKSTHTSAPPETVDRTLLREVLLRGIGKENITYSRKLTHYTEASSTVTVHFANGTTATGTLLVGADGAHSAVRQQFLPEQEVLDVGGRCIYGRTPLTAELKTAIMPELLGGMCGIKDRSDPAGEVLSTVVEPVTFPRRDEMLANGFACPEDYLYWVIVSLPERMGFKPDEKVNLTLAEAEALTRRLTQGWHESVRPVFEMLQLGETAALTISAVKPDFETWEANPRVTLLGDAVHLMGPTAGSGAITALRDARGLCEAIVADAGSQESIAKYESTMREYAGEIVELSWQGAKHIFGSKGYK